jgi:hypothetical protein
MKVAFVNQAIDRLVPPNQNSVGACTLGVAKPLTRTANVLVYGLKDNHLEATDSRDYGVEFRFIPSTAVDRMLFRAQKVYGKLFGRSSPISASQWLYPNYGRQIALDLKRHECDVIHLQHCSQYAPVIRAHNPRTKIVLHLHAEWFSQTNPAMLARRLQPLT